MHSKRYTSTFILLHVKSQSYKYNLLKMFSFYIYIFSFFIKNRVFICVWINIGVFSSIALISLSVFMSISSCFYYCSSIIELNVRDGDTSRSSFLVQDDFGYPGFFVLPYEVDYCSFKVCEELCWYFDWDCIESIDHFW